MQRYTYSDSFLAAYLKKNYIVYEWQAENFDHIELNQRYKIERYPTVLFITASGKEISRLIGFQSANEIQKASDLILHPIKLKTVSQTQTPVKKGTKK
jgi:thioredoxin-related protein